VTPVPRVRRSVRRAASVAAGLAVVLAAGCGTTGGGAGGSPSVIPSADRTGIRTPVPPSPAPPDGSVRPTPDAEVPPCSGDQAGTPVEGGLPDIALDCLGAGPAVNLAKVRGKPLIVNVWAQWCTPCRAEAPYLAELARKAPAQGVLVYGIDFIDPRPELARAFAREHGLAYPHLTDPDKQLGRPLKLIGPPATVFVGADGVVREIHRGPFTSYQQLRALARDELGVTL
jgi:cytochrome c biogenesis protein CcmG/thiol:disulfide interchange protein DsbE